MVDQSLAEGVVTEDLANGGKAYKTSEVGNYLANLIDISQKFLLVLTTAR